MKIDGVEASLLGLLKELDYAKYDVDLCLQHNEGPWMSEIPKQVHLLPELQVHKRCERLVKFLIYWIAGIYYRVFRRSHIDPVGDAQITYAIRSFFGWFPRKLSDKYYDECWIFGGNPGFAKRIDASIKKTWVHEDWGAWEPIPFLARQQFKGVDYVVNVSVPAKDQFDALDLISGNTQSVVIENVLSVRWLMERATAYEVPNFDGVKLLSVGRASASKNYGRAVAAAKILKSKGLRFKWVVIGDGWALEGLRKKTQEFNVADVIEFVGGNTNPCPYYRWCDIYVCTSDTESKGMTICEAHEFNKPVIMTNFPAAHTQVIDSMKDIIVEMSEYAIADAILGQAARMSV